MCQGFLRATDGSDARVVLKRVKRRVEVRTASLASERQHGATHCCQCSLLCVLPQRSPDRAQKPAPRCYISFCSSEATGAPEERRRRSAVLYNAGLV